ncbi:MAG: polysaccharide pyruvyl transferase CsaB [Candidatus Obscuribacterales bacterium]|nr:polysaccharide pyruvyl transferase CsaB [Candidatus Obscuribacterales bacterium]
MKVSGTRNKIVVSGYYGFDNLGDEAILEVLTSELKEFSDPQNIVVLSQDPETTKKRYGVTAINRWRLPEIAAQLRQARLFVSGGGGLFQDTESVKSVIYYGGLISIATACGAPTFIYAQGLGPLKTALARLITRLALAQPALIAVRDSKSLALLQEWRLPAYETGDPVWLMEPSALPPGIENKLKQQQGKILALSLRKLETFGDGQIRLLAQSLSRTFADEYTLLALPLQRNQDQEALSVFTDEWLKLGGRSLELDFALIEKPSQWLALISQVDFLVGMRLHSLIMALSQNVPVAGLAYDPKVSHVLEEFEAISLPLQAEKESDYAILLKDLFNNEAGKAAIKGQTKTANHLLRMRQAACQNKALLAKILSY